MQNNTARIVAGADQNELHVMIGEMISDAQLQHQFERQPDRAASLLAQTREAVRRGFVERSAPHLHAVHRVLYDLYEQNVQRPGPTLLTNQFNPTLLEVRAHIENVWQKKEQERVNIPERLDQSPEQFLELFRAACSAHRASHHELFDFLEHSATREQFESFFISDCALNVRFYDFIALSLVGIEGIHRQELATNFWDEVGRGDESRAHTGLFKRVLAHLGVPESPNLYIDRLSWQGLAGINLFYLFSVHRANHFKMVGNMAVTELLDPSQYAKLLRGCKRVGLHDPEALAYYAEHVEIDIVHGDGWLQNVIAPMLGEGDFVRRHLLLGAGMRLNSTLDYYDDLLDRLMRRPS